MLLAGEVDAVIGVGPIDSPQVRSLFPEADEADKAWHNSTGIFPISHLLVVRDELLAEKPWLAEELFLLFAEAKKPYIDGMATQESAVPQDKAQQKMSDIVGGDPIPYDFESTYKTLEAFIEFNVNQGIIPAPMKPEELFPEQTLGLKG
jgi:4,5-dihydroxyphthalate decarboxylase